MNIAPQPLAEAVARFSEKTPIGSTLRSAGWEDMPLALRNGAFWSAGIEDVRTLNAMQTRLDQALTMSRAASGPYMDRSLFIREVRRIAAEQGLGSMGQGSPDDLTDITSASRLGLIYDMQIRGAEGFARRKTGLSEGALDAVPAWEFVRIYPRLHPRDEIVPGYWEDRWVEACDAAGDDAARAAFDSSDRMVALKTSDVWMELSAFGTPWAPFDYGSGMGLAGVLRADAVELGLLDDDELLQPPAQDSFETSLQASIKDLSPEFRQALKSLFGPQIAVDGDTAWWQDSIESYEAFTQQQRSAAQDLAQRLSVRLDSSLGPRVSHDSSGSGRAAETRDTAAAQVSAVAIGRKPLYLESFQSGPDAQRYTDAIRAELRDASVTVAQVESGGQHHVLVYRPDTVPGSPQEILDRFALGRGGRALGYGTEEGTPGNRYVAISRRGQNPTTGFEAPGSAAGVYAAARERDFSDVFGPNWRARLLDVLAGNSAPLSAVSSAVALAKVEASAKAALTSAALTSAALAERAA